MKRACSFLLCLGLAAPAAAETIYAVNGAGSLLQIDSATATIVDTVAISGVAGVVVGIDFRPLDGVLYALANDPGGAGAGLYTLNPDTGVATPVAGLSPDPADLSDPFAGLSGEFFGMDRASVDAGHP